MLYVSRSIGAGFGVVDTDDGTETIVTREEIEGIVNLGVSIVGVETMKVRSGKLIVTAVSINKGPSNGVVHHGDLKTPRAVYVEVKSDQIVSIQWGVVPTGGEHVVLSNYGLRCNEHTRFWAQPEMYAGRCTDVEFILDDKISMTEPTILSAFSCRHAVLNITHVTNPDTVRMAYKMLYKYLYVDCYSKKMAELQDWAKHALSKSDKACAEERIRQAEMDRRQEFVSGFDTFTRLIDLPARKMQWRTEILKKI